MKQVLAVSPERNGVGAVRELRTGRAWFHEEITEFERPRRTSYRVIDPLIPIEHVGGSIVLAAIPASAARRSPGSTVSEGGDD